MFVGVPCRQSASSSLQGKYEEAKAAAIEMRDIFEPGDFYIELQDHHLPEDKIVMNPLCQIAREIGVKVVATNDVHYIEKRTPTFRTR